MVSFPRNLASVDEAAPAVNAAAASPKRFEGRTETVLGTLPGVCESSRTVVILSRSLCGHTSLRLQTESRSANIGWYPQGSVDLSAEQLAAIKPLLGLAASRMQPEPSTADAPATIPFARRA